MENKQFLTMQASAGSGKTYALACRYVYLLLEGAKVGEILTLTFTNKAANEMRARIAYFLQILGSEDLQSSKEANDREGVLKTLEQEYGLKREKIIALSPSLLKNFYASTPKIMTIDAFLNSIVKRFCWYMGVPHSFELKDVEQEEIYSHFFSSLSQKQKDLFLQICFSQGKSISSVLEMIEKVQMNYPKSFKDRVYGDLEEIKERAVEIGEEIVKRVLNHPQATKTAHKNIVFADFDELRSKSWISKGLTLQYLSKLDLDPTLFDELKSTLKEYYAIKESLFLDFLQTFCDLYQKSKDWYIKQHQSLGFDDITKKCYSLLCEESVGRDFFYFRLDDKISHILLDEFQDTSVLQYKLLYPLIDEIRSGEGRVGERSFFVVGDQKQSIYKFRGGEGRLMEDVEENFSLDRQNLDTNYRSAKEIVEFVNEVFQPHFSHYVPQKSQKNGGYVYIFDAILSKEESKQKAFSQIKDTLSRLLSLGAKLEEIAIIAFSNQDVLEVGDFLKNYYENIITEESISLDKKRDAQIILNALQYSKNLSSGIEDEFLRAKLAKLLGLGIDESFESVEWRSEGIASLVYDVILTYELDSLEAQRVLEIACGCKDLEELLEGVKESRGGEEENEGLRVLTIHKSKGLEFKHLIVLDRLGGKNNAKEKIICHYDKELNGVLFISESGREDVDEVFAYVKEQEDQKDNIEKKNVLYVALTRACESLWIMPIIPSRGGSEFALLNLVDKEGEILVKKEWGKLEITQNLSAPRRKTEKILVEQKDFGRQEGYIQNLSAPYKPNHIPSIKKGEAFHKALEMYLGYHIKREEIKDFLDNHYGLYLDDVEKKDILESLEKIYTLLVKEFHFNELKTEISFMLENKLYRIDCLLLDRDESGEVRNAIVLDYKSGGGNAYYQEQIGNYVGFVKSKFENAKVEGYLVYKDCFELVKIDI